MGKTVKANARRRTTRREKRARLPHFRANDEQSGYLGDIDHALQRAFDVVRKLAES